MRIRLLVLCCFFVSFLSAWTNELSGETPAPGSAQTYEVELEKGQQLLRQHKHEEALKSFKRANEMRGKKSGEAFFWMAQAYQALGAYKNVLENSDKALALNQSDPELQAQTYNLKGLALHSQSEGKHQKKLQEAEAIFRQALTLTGAPAVVHYNLALSLMQQNRDPEGIASLRKYVELQRSGGYVEAARKLIANPRRAREAYAPDFSITTSEGEHLTLEDLRGKVVVLDFWGTWCPPCVASVPSLRNLRKRYEKEPSFMLVGISSDPEEEPWRTFIAKNKMVWPQYRDRDRQIQRAFGVSAFPTYVVIDQEGIIRFRTSGTSWERSAHLSEEIKRQVKLVAKTATTN
ncbi:MAG TPA: redoxin domain-containing protein [Thermoanaerobaculia bacterium]|nr:redoxin domain-containing protein [Thermoanaerobaculia bacterium]